MRSILFISVVLSGLFCAGCATTPYKYGQNEGRPPRLMLRENELQIEKGKSCWPIDGLGNILSIPSKALLLNVYVDSHWISTNTVNTLSGYLEDNELDQVKVRVNQYAPFSEWSRLFRNKSVGFGWRYTLGLFSAAWYTVVPGRLFGGDSYNPYTQTINLYSSHKAIALHEGAHAKDAAGRKLKGTYSAIRMLPVVALYQEAVATSDAIGYLRDKKNVKDEKSAYRTLYPAYSTYVSGEILTFYTGPSATAIAYSTLGLGHLTGWIKSFTVGDEQ